MLTIYYNIKVYIWHTPVYVTRFNYCFNDMLPRNYMSLSLKLKTNLFISIIEHLKKNEHLVYSYSLVLTGFYLRHHFLYPPRGKIQY